MRPLEVRIQEHIAKAMRKVPRGHTAQVTTRPALACLTELRIEYNGKIIRHCFPPNGDRPR